MGPRSAGTIGGMSDDARAIWERIGAHWDDQVGEGNVFQTDLVMPATDSLLDAKPGERVLDACCGNGNYSRRLGRAGCSVTAFDGSSILIDRARQRTRASDGEIRFSVVDACDSAALQAIDGPFDAVVCSFALMDLPTITPLFAASRKLLKAGGRFVWSIGHPAFHTNESTPVARQSQGEGTAEQSFGIEVTRYAADWPHRSRGLLGQPEPHWIYHRSLSTLFAEGFSVGFVVDGLIEPTFAPDSRARSPFSWARRPDIPPAIVVRMRPTSL